MADSSNPRVQRWHRDLVCYDMHVEHVPGETNVVADGITRVLAITPSLSYLWGVTSARAHSSTHSVCSIYRLGLADDPQVARETWHIGPSQYTVTKEEITATYETVCALAADVRANRAAVRAALRERQQACGAQAKRAHHHHQSNRQDGSTVSNSWLVGTQLLDPTWWMVGLRSLMGLLHFALSCLMLWQLQTRPGARSMCLRELYDWAAPRRRGPAPPPIPELPAVPVVKAQTGVLPAGPAPIRTDAPVTAAPTDVEPFTSGGRVR